MRSTAERHLAELATQLETALRSTLSADLQLALGDILAMEHADPDRLTQLVDCAIAHAKPVAIPKE